VPDHLSCLAHIRVAADHVPQSEQTVWLNTYHVTWTMISHQVATHVYELWDQIQEIMQHRMREQISHDHMIAQFVHVAHMCVTNLIEQIGTPS